MTVPRPIIFAMVFVIGGAGPTSAGSAALSSPEAPVTNAPRPAEALPAIDALWAFADPAASEAKFRATLPAAERAGDVGYRLQLLTQIARAQGLRKQFTEAHATLDEVEKSLGEKADDAAMAVPRLRYLLERGRVFNSARQAAQALPLFERAWELGRGGDQDGYAIDAAHMLGIASATPEQQIEWSRRAMAAAEQSADERGRRWLGPLYNNLGWTYHDRGDFAQALELFEKGVDFRARRPQEAEPLRIAHWSVARALRSLGRHDEALAIQRDLLRQYENAGRVSGLVFEEIGECLLAQGRPDEATPWFAKAHPELVKEGWLEWEPQRVERVKELGGVRD